MKFRFYHWMFCIGALMSCAMLLDLFDIPDWASTLCAWISMLGGGVLCSAFVSNVFEKNEKKKKEAQREYLLKNVKNKFQQICMGELHIFSHFYSRVILDNQETFCREPLSIRSVGQKICDLINKIEGDRKENTEIYITAKDIEFEEQKSKFLLSHNMNYYTSLLRLLTEISDNFSLYLASDIFSESDIDNINVFIGYVQNIIDFSSDMNLYDGTFLEFKKCFFENTSEFMSLLGIPDDTTILCFYKPIRN